MSSKHVDAAGLARWVQGLIDAGTVYAPQSKEDRFAFGALAKAGDLRLDYDVTLLPPKKFFQPQREVLLTFTRSAGYRSVISDETFVLLGVHPYDMAAITQMDRVFAMRNCDEHYARRRSNATIVVSDVVTPSADVFAGCMGFAASDSVEGHDVVLTPMGSSDYVIEAVTAKGEALMAGLHSAAEASEDLLAGREAVRAANRRALRRHELKMRPSEIPRLMEGKSDHPVWEEKARLCYGCGSCNLVCPTCYCFDVHEELDWDLESGERARTWDGCMLTSFAAVADGHNFRSKRVARYRHRYYRKGKYVPEMLGGEISCVGCGRCIQACTAGIANPVEIFNRLQEGA